jgi:tripartite-type tricarboxylate transporter receptor subunit TctC
MGIAGRKSVGLAAAVLAGAILMSNEGVRADTYPSRTIRLVVPYGPGGASDQLARAVADRLTSALGQPVVIDNKPGAGTIVGTDFVAKATPDGYTVGLATFATLVSNPLLSANVPYRPESDFDGVGLLATSPMVLVVGPDLPTRDVKAFVEYAKANPGKINYGSSGAGSTVHLAAELFKAVTGAEMLHVPYKSSPEVLTAIAGGFLQAAVDVVITAKPQIEAGKVKALAVTDSVRTTLMPDVPTVAESGYPEYAASTWYGLVVPRGTPGAAIARLNAELAKVAADPELQKRFAALGMELKSSGSEEVLQLAARERAKWEKIVAAQGLRAK